MVTRFFKEDIKRVLRRKTTWFAMLFFMVVIIANVLFIYSELPVGNPYYEPYSAFEYFISVQGGESGFVMLILPLIITVTVGDFFISERLSSMLSYSLTRATKVTAYMRGRVLSLGMVSFIAVLTVQLVTLVVL